MPADEFPRGGLIGQIPRGGLRQLCDRRGDAVTGTVLHPLTTTLQPAPGHPAYFSGGLVGNKACSSDSNGVIIDSPVTQSYASGAVTGSTAGGLIGFNSGATVSYGYALVR